MYSRLQYISQGIDGEEHIANIRLALEGGCKWIQLRVKNKTKQELLSLAICAKELCRKFDAILIINDYIDVADKSGADGVHLGLEDDYAAMAIGRLGENKIVGGSANTYEDCLKQAKEGCDYIGLGPFRHTVTKEKLSPVLGIEGFRRIMSQLNKERFLIPIYAIGGITANDIDDLMEARVYGVAISGAITKAVNKKETIEIMNSKLNRKYVEHSR